MKLLDNLPRINFPYMNYHDLYDNWARNAEIAKKFTEDFKEE
jgi:hypothetical protein